MAMSNDDDRSELDSKSRARILGHLQRAITSEEEGWAFYHAAAERMQEPLARQVLESLAEDERHHVDIVKQRFRSIERGEAFGDVEALLAERRAEESEQLEIGQAMRRARRPLPITATVRQVYRAAIEFERDGALLYEELAADAVLPMERKFFELLREMEREHLEILDNTLHYLEDPEHWLSIQERWLVEG